MKREEGNIEILLLLCCLVGVVAFFALSLAFTRAISDVIPSEKDNRQELLQDYQNLLRMKAEKEERLKTSEDLLDQLDKKRGEIEKSLLNKGQVSEELWKSKKDNIDALTREYEALKSRLENLKRELSATQPVLGIGEKEAEIIELKKQLEALVKEINKKTEELMNISNSPQDKNQAESLGLELERLNREYDLLKEKLEKLRRELNSLPKPDNQERRNKEEELKILQKKLEELRKKIDEESKNLDIINNKLGSNPLANKRMQLEQAKNKIQKEIVELENRINILKKSSWTRGARFRNPLFVDCREHVCVLYPAGETIAIADIESKKILEQKATGRDIIVFLIRPDGFDSYYKVSDKVKSLPIARGYEPIEASEKLDYLME